MMTPMHAFTIILGLLAVAHGCNRRCGESNAGSACALGSVQTPSYDETTSPSTIQARWMTSLPDSKPISSMTIPGTHNSGTFPGWGEELAQCQSWSLADQYRAGIRFVDIRARLTGNAFAIHHEAYFQYRMFGNLLQDTINFLNANPREVIFMRVRQEHTVGPDNTMSFDQVLQNYLSIHQSYIWNSPELPSTLGQARGKIVVLTGGESAVGVSFYGKINPISDDWSLGRIEKWAAVQAALQRSNCVSGISLTFTSSSKFPEHPSFIAQYVNQRLYNFVSSKPRGTCLGFVVMDFPGAELVGKLIALN